MKRLLQQWRVWLVVGLVAGFVAGPAAPVFADDVSALGDDTADVARGKGPAKGGKDKHDLPKFEDVAKDHKEIPGPEGQSGFLPLYYNKEKDQLLAVVPSKMLGENFLVAASIAGGPNFAGYMWGNQVVHFEKRDKKLVLIQPELRYKKPSAKKSEVADVIDRTYTDSILTAIPIVAEKGGDPVIDLGDLFMKDFVQAGRVFGGSMNRSLSRWAKYKAFPQNVELEVEGAFMQGSSGGTRALIHYSLVELPKNDYEPREADARVGYFLTAVKDWTTPHDEETIFKRYIHRWDVRKAEPSRELSDVDPDHRITFYIEKTVPVQYRRYIREGILAWNRAFEQAGFRNAVKVEQQTDTVHADKDPEDVRYAFFRWIVSGRSFAMGPSLANPMTGEILDADIIMDDSMARSWEMQYGRYTGTSLAAYEDPALRRFLEKHPEWDFKPLHERLLPETASYGGTDLMLDPDIFEHLQHQHGFCTYANGLAHEMAFSSAFLAATGNEACGEEFVGQMIRHVATHEVGHTLGLRHNFKASSWKSLKEMMSNTNPDNPVVASVMDYNSGLFNPEKAKQALFVSPTVGPYDEAAIEYGYKPFDPKESDHKNEREMLSAMASRIAQDGFDYATDEDTGFFAPDPLVNRFDASDDIIAYAKQRMEMVRELQKDIADWAVKDGESYRKLRSAFDMMLYEYSRVANFAARYVGGQYINRDQKGDPNGRPPIQIVEAAKQRAALDFLIDTIFSDRDFQFDPAVLNMLAAGRWSHWGSDAYDSQLDYPIHDRISGLQRGTLFRVLNPFTLSRIYDAEMKVSSDEDGLTIPEVLDRMTNAIWSETGKDPSAGKYTTRKPFVSSVRRSLQRQHLQTMLNMVLDRPGAMMPADIQAVATLNLRGLSKNLGQVLESRGAGNLDDFTRAHFEECKARIDKALEAKYEL